MTDTTTAHTSAPSPRSPWHDGDTMLSFAAFAIVVLALLIVRVSDPAHWIAIVDAGPPIEQSDGACGRSVGVGD